MPTQCLGLLAPKKELPKRGCLTVCANELKPEEETTIKEPVTILSRPFMRTLQFGDFIFSWRNPPPSTFGDAN